MDIKNEARVNEDLDQKSLLRKYERELKKLRAELEARSKNVVDKRRLLELDEQRKRACFVHIGVALAAPSVGHAVSTKRKANYSRVDPDDGNCEEILEDLETASLNTATARGPTAT